MATIVAADPNTRAEAALREVESIASFATHAVVLHPAQVRKVDTSLQHQVFEQTPDRVVGQRRDDRGSKTEAAAQATRHVVLASPFPGSKVPRRVDPALTRIEPQHHF